MIDLTAITTPYGLLNTKTQQALKEHGGPYEYYVGGCQWQQASSVSWNHQITYRACRRNDQVAA